MITVDLGNGIITEMEEHLLTPRLRFFENDHEKTAVSEYLYQGKVVHRSVHVQLKKGLGIEGILGQIG